MTFFIDTAVIMFAAGADHPLREPCQAVLRLHADQRIGAVTSAEVVQETLHRFSRGDRAVGDRMGRRARSARSRPSWRSITRSSSGRGR